MRTDKHEKLRWPALRQVMRGPHPTLRNPVDAGWAESNGSHAMMVAKDRCFVGCAVRTDGRSR